MATYKTITDSSSHSDDSYTYPCVATEGERVYLRYKVQGNYTSGSSSQYYLWVGAYNNGALLAENTENDYVYGSDILTVTAYFTVPLGATSVKCCFSSAGNSSDLDDNLSGADEVYSCLVTPANTAPTTPATLTVSANPIGGQACTISWGASTDADGNLDGYKLQRSVDGGTTWTQVYQGNALTTTNTVPWGSNTVMYRVQAYDTDGAVSSWKTATETDVFNNHAPTAPDTLTLPATLYAGVDNTISWSAGADEDGNLSGYILQFAGDDGDFTTIYSGSARTFAHLLPTGLTDASYRVQAVDAFDAVSGWTTETTSEIINNRPPVITMDDYSDGDDLGTVTAAPSLTYQVADADGDDVATSVLLDGVVIDTADVTLDADNAISWTADEWMQVRNGLHDIQIVADDGTTVSQFGMTVTKAVNSLSVTLENTLPADAKIRWCTMLVKGLIPADASMSLLVTNDADADNPTWEDMTEEAKTGVKHTFTHAPTSGHAFQFQLTLEVGDSGKGGYTTALTGGFQ